MHFREGCHLCEDMQQQLNELFDPGEFRLTLIDIDEDESLREAYNVRVPVLSLISRQSALQHSSSASGAVSTASDANRGVKAVAGTATEQPESDENRLKNAILQELCEHFLDLVAVREALASYNKPLPAACNVRVPR